jgi:hypothetical protein
MDRPREPTLVRLSSESYPTPIRLLLRLEIDVESLLLLR